MTNPRALDDFLGAWRIERTITHVGAPPASFAGQAIWTTQPDGALYTETGTLTIPGATPMQAERRYLWRGLDVYFDDGRFFHTVPPMGGKTQHWCDPDDYRVAYDFSQWPRFNMEWTVSGPRKAYVMRSVFSKVLQP